MKSASITCLAGILFLTSAVSAGAEEQPATEAAGRVRLLGNGFARTLPPIERNSPFESTAITQTAGDLQSAPLGIPSIIRAWATGSQFADFQQGFGCPQDGPFQACESCGYGWQSHELRDPRWYISGMVGVSNWNDEHNESINANTFTEIDIDYNDTVAGGITFGRLIELSPRLPMRIECELLIREAKVDSIIQNGLQQQGIAGDSRLFTAMANFLWDLKFVNERIYPYLGGGVGLAHINRDITIGNVLLDDSDIAFAGQTVLGITVKIKKDFDFYVDWRYTWTADTVFKSHTTHFTNRTKFESEHQNSTVMFGLRIFLDNLPFFGKPWCHPNCSPYDPDSIRPALINYAGSY